MTSVSAEDVRLYRALLSQLVGPYAAEVRQELGGELSSDVFLAVLERVRSRVRSDRAAAELELDGIDWAAIRALVPAIRQHVTPAEFNTLTGSTVEDMLALSKRADAEIRRFNVRGGFINFQRGACLVALPAIEFVHARKLHGFVGIPDESTWDSVMPPCARRLRSEMLAELKDHYRGQWTWIERSAGSLEELSDLIHQHVDSLRSRAMKPDST